MAKYINTVNVAGVELEVSKLRIGTKCKCCGKPITNWDYIQTSTKSCNVAYVCSDCIKHREYGSDLQNKDIIAGKLTSGQYRFAIEIEANYFPGTDIVATDAYLAAQWGLQPSRDCTVDVEYHMTNKVNFHGLKDFVQDVANHVVLDASNCGHHINLSKITWTASDMERIRWHKSELFSELLETMVNQKEATKNLFGRYFSDYCDSSISCHHGDWLNLDKTYHIEFRLPHFVNANQFFYCSNFCRDIIDILDKYLNNEFDESKASEKMVHRFNVYANGKATCQRKERNTVAR